MFKHLFARYYAQNVRFSYWRGKKDREVDLVAEVGGDDAEREMKLFTQDDSALADDTALIQGGIVDSTGILELIMFLEETWSIKVRDEEMVPDNFETIDAITAFVTRKLAA